MEADFHPMYIGSQQVLPRFFTIDSAGLGRLLNVIMRILLLIMGLGLCGLTLGLASSYVDSQYLWC